MDLLKTLIVVSEKAANIARVCRKDDHLFQLLVEKKKSDESNPRFVEDFKTLADVLIQEMVKHDIGKQFPSLFANINGEENNVFKNTLGETICVEVKPTEIETSNLLETVLNGDKIAASLLAAEVHKDLKLSDMEVDKPRKEFTLNIEEIGIWIDPIDCTAEYVHGNVGRCLDDIQICGLRCVTILIGAFNKKTGAPVMGVVNRPFLEETDFQYCTQCVWGVFLPNFIEKCRLPEASRQNIICISASENEDIKEKLRKRKITLIEASGAGYKILTVILGLADAYILSKGTTYKWDTCAPHAILKTIGGDIIEYTQAEKSSELKSISYFLEESNCNENGIIVYKDKAILKEIIDVLKS